MKKLIILAAFLMLVASFAYAADCPPGYEFQPNSGVGCVQSNCFSIANAHLSYEGRCVCGSSGSIEENPADPNKECYSQNESCPGCVVACVGLDQSCPGEQMVNDLPDTDSSSDSGSENLVEDWGSDWEVENWEEDWGDADWGPYEWPDLYPDEDGEDIDVDDSGRGWDDLGDDIDPFELDNREDRINNSEIDSDYDFDDEAYKDALSGGVSESFNPDGFMVLGEMNPFSYPGGKEMQGMQDDTTDFFSQVYESTRDVVDYMADYSQIDLPFTGEDGAWVFKSSSKNPETGEVTDIKWFGGDFQLGWSDGFKTQIYIADVGTPGAKNVDGYTIGMGITLEWKDKFKFSVGVPGTPISLNIVPRDIYNSLGRGVDAIRDGVKSISIIDNAMDLQRRQAEKNK
ncbi:MAG: hypothetical protein ABID38_06485 [Candidatus Diapherotrites archaeon]